MAESIKDVLKRAKRPMGKKKWDKDDSSGKADEGKGFWAAKSKK